MTPIGIYASRWQAVRDRLNARGYKDIPTSPPAEGWVYAPPELPRVGVWVMPDNQLPGMLEDFVARLIPLDDTLLRKAEAILQEIELDCLNCTCTSSPSQSLDSHLASLAGDAWYAYGTGNYSAGAQL